MKTLKQSQLEKKAILNEIAELQLELKSAAHDEYRKIVKQINAAKKKLAKIKDMVLYLETSPKKEFIEAEAAKLKKRQKLIEASFLKDRTNESYEKMTLKDQTKKKMDYYKEMGLPKLKMQLSTLNYLLS